MPYMVINITKLEDTTVLNVTDGPRAALWGRIYKAKGCNVIAPPLEGRGFAKLELDQLQYMYWNLTQQTPTADYADMLHKVSDIVATIKHDDTPVETLEAEVRRLYPDELPTATPAAATSEKKQREPRVPREPGAAPDRPKATSTTGMVWELADNALAEVYPQEGAIVDWKVVRAALMKLTDAAGINAATAATQYSKWKAAKLAGKAA